MMGTFRERLADEAGIALITVMLVGAVLAGLGILMVTTTVSDLNSANSDRAAVRTLDVAEAGVSDAIAYMRSKGVKQICSSCTAVDWNTGHTITYPRGQALVTIQAVNPYKPPQVRTGRYLIQSVATTTGSGASGASGVVAGKRTVQELVDIRPLSFPLGVYTASQVNLGGTVNMLQESLFSGSCVDSRYKLQMLAGPTGSTIDPFYNIPAAVHSTSYITDKNTSCAVDPSGADSQAIHKTSTCNSTYPADQDALGGPFPADASGNACRTATTGYGDYGTNGSGFNNTTFVNSYGFLPRGLSDDDYAQLKAKAIAAGTYFPAGTSIVWPTASTDPTNAGYNPVIYIQNQNVTIQSGDLAGYAWQSDPTCTQTHPEAIVIVDHGDLNISSGASLSGFIFVPDGNIKFTGSPTVIGTMFSKSLDWSGGSTVGLNDCFAQSTSGGILNVTKYAWREVDS